MTTDLKYKSLFLSSESAKCLLCKDAPCSENCPEGQDAAKMVRSVRFENSDCVRQFFDPEKCLECEGYCEKACIHYDGAVSIRRIACAIDNSKGKESLKVPDLSVDFCSVKCENPFFLSSSVVASGYDMCAAALRAGWAGIVYKTIANFKPEEVSPRFDAVGKESTPFIGFRNLEQTSEHSPDENFEILHRLKKDFPGKIIVASIMGRDEEEWSHLAKRAESCGADMIECNFSCPHMSAHGLGADVGTNPELVAAYTLAVKKVVSIPVLAKMTPNIQNIEIPAIAAVEAGADGLAAINTIKSISGLDLESGTPCLSVNGKSAVSGYSGKAIKPIALRFIYDMASNKSLSGVPISGMGGIETWRDAVEFISLGCLNLQVTTAVMQYGYRIIDDLITGLANYMSQNGYKSVSEMCGSALRDFVSSDELDRDTIEYPMFMRDKCVGCGRCFISCQDAGHQAISFDSESRKVKLIPSKCVGCQLCRLVCPCGAIGKAKRQKKNA